MKLQLFISYDFFSKILNLANYLEYNSQHIIDLIEEMSNPIEHEESYVGEIRDILYSINIRSLEIKEKLIETSIIQQKVLEFDSSFENVFKLLSDDIKRIQSKCTEIENPNHYIDKNGNLIDKK